MTAIGAVLADKYRVLAKLGEGGMGSVFRAENLLTGKQVALKCLHPHVISSASASERLLREARAASSLSHPNVVDVYDVVRDGETLFLVMELFRGETLRDYLERNPQPKISEFIAMILPALSGVAAAHEQGVIHRDLKPDNIFLAQVAGVPNRVIKVLDFGIAKLAVARGPTLTQTGVALGTPLYMCLEQLRGDKDIDQRVDVYAFGVMLYEAVTGSLPYEAETLPELAIKVATTDPLPVKSLRPDVPTSLARVIDWAVARERSQRLPDILTLQRELEVFARDHSFREQMTNSEVPMPRLAAEPAAVGPEGAPTLVAAQRPARPPLPAAGGGVRAQPRLRSEPDTLRARELVSSESSAQPPRMRRRLAIGSVALVGALIVGAWLATRPPLMAAGTADTPQPNLASTPAAIVAPALSVPTAAVPTVAVPPVSGPSPILPPGASPVVQAPAVAALPEPAVLPIQKPAEPLVQATQPVPVALPKPKVSALHAVGRQPGSTLATASQSLTNLPPATSTGKAAPVVSPPAPVKKKSSSDLVGF